MASSLATEPKLTVDPTEDIKELAETLTESEVSSGIISADNEAEEAAATDRFQQRLDRFGKIAPEAKKISRALRFGTAHEAVDGVAKKRRLDRFGAVPHSTEEEQQKKRQRGDRFHVINASPIDAETKKKRVDRFGVVTPSTTPSKKNKAGEKSTSTTPVLSDAVKTRAERFGDISQAAKTTTLNAQQIKRAERFKPITSA